MVTVSERTGSMDELFRAISDNIFNRLRVATPAIVTGFDPTEQTITAKVAIKERMRDENGTLNDVQIPELLDVPVVFPRAGGFILSFPVNVGDECLIIFGDQCIDAWWQNGGVQSPIELRRHDLSDSFAIMGTWSQPRRIVNYPTDRVSLMTDDGVTSITLKPGEINLNATEVKVNGTSIVPS